MSRREDKTGKFQHKLLHDISSGRQKLKLNLNNLKLWLSEMRFSSRYNWAKGLNWKSPKVILPTLGVAVALAGGAIYLGTASNAYAINVNSQQVAILKTKAEAEDALHSVLLDKGKSVGQVAFTKDKVLVTPVKVKEIDINPEFVAIRSLSSKLTAYIKGYNIVVNGKTIMTLASQAQANEVLQKVKDNYAKPENQQSIESVSFEENVGIQEQDTDPSQVTPVDRAVKSLLEGNEQSVEYAVQPSDTLWTIARNNDMRIKDLVAANPDLNTQDALQIGQKIDIVTVEPYLHVVVKGTGTRIETIPFGTTYKSDGTLSPGSSKTITAGVAGSKTVNYKFTLINGDASDEVILAQTITQQPVTRVVAQGPAARTYVASTSRGSGHVGSLIWPARGPITSPYGPRSRGFHTGLDIGVGTGTTYVAAASGVVTLAGWDGGYGKCIVIDHGNGVQTRYAHSSALMVKVGQHVSQGEPIGLSGSTGNATGPHLHFEVIINGNTVNPLNYL